MANNDQPLSPSWNTPDGELIQHPAAVSALLDRLVASTAPGHLHQAHPAQRWATVVRGRYLESYIRLDLPIAAGDSPLPAADAWLQVSDELGVPVRFPTRIANSDPHSLLIEAPDQVLRVQRRESHRVAVAAARNGIRILTDNPALQAARLVDISLGGVGFVVSATQAAKLPKVGEQVPARLVVSVSGYDPLNVPVTLEIRNQFVQGSLQAYRVGVAFHGLTPAQEQKLHRICMNLSRNVLRTRVL